LGRLRGTDFRRLFAHESVEGVIDGGRGSSRDVADAIRESRYPHGLGLRFGVRASPLPCWRGAYRKTRIDHIPGMYAAEMEFRKPFE
jgi:hypothetical protein